MLAQFTFVALPMTTKQHIKQHKTKVKPFYPKPNPKQHKVKEYQRKYIGFIQFHRILPEEKRATEPITRKIHRWS